MRIEEDCRELLLLLQSKLDAGYAWVSVDTAKELLKMRDLKFFKSKVLANDYAKNTGNDRANIFLLSALNREVQSVRSRHKKNVQSKTPAPDDLNIDVKMLGTASKEMARSREKSEHLQLQLQAWGIPYELASVFEELLTPKNPGIVMEHRASNQGDVLKNTLYLNPDKNGQYDIHAFTCVLKRQIDIPDITIVNVNSRHLDKLMSRFDWTSINPFHFLLQERNIGFEEMRDQAIALAAKLDALSLIPQGKEAAEKLIAKHWLGTPFEGIIDNVQELDKKYIIRQNFDRIGDTIFTMQEAYNLMCERYVSKAISEDGKTLHPWYYRSSGEGASFANIVRITNSENLDLEKVIGQLGAKDISLTGSVDDVIRSLRQGDEVKGEKITGVYKQDFKVYFNPFLNELEATKLGRIQHIEQSEDNHLKRGRSL